MFKVINPRKRVATQFHIMDCAAGQGSLIHLRMVFHVPSVGGAEGTLEERIQDVDVRCVQLVCEIARQCNV